MTITFAPEAEADLVAVIGYLADRNAEAAVELRDRIFTIIDRLAAPELEGPQQTLASGVVVHSWPVPPVRGYYQRHGHDVLWVLRVYHQARAPIAR